MWGYPVTIWGFYLGCLAEEHFEIFLGYSFYLGSICLVSRKDTQGFEKSRPFVKSTEHFHILTYLTWNAQEQRGSLLVLSKSGSDYLLSVEDGLVGTHAVYLAISCTGSQSLE